MAALRGAASGATRSSCSAPAAATTPVPSSSCRIIALRPRSLAPSAAATINTTNNNTNHRCRGVRARPSVAAAAAAASNNTNPTDIVCVGEALFDLIADQKGVPRDKVASWTGYPGGAPCNVATAAARLGASAAFVSSLGRDPRGDELLALLRERAVDVSQVQRPRSHPTRAVYVVRTADGDREFSGFGGPTETYSDCFLDADALDLAALQNARCVVTGTLGLAYPASRRAIERAVKAAREAGAVVLVDVNWRPVFWPPEEKSGGGDGGGAAEAGAARRVILDFLSAHADVVKVSDADLEYLCAGVTCDEALSNPCSLLGGGEGAASSPSLASALLASLPLPRAAGVLVTAGEKGASYCFRAANKGAHSGFVPAYDVGVADTTGAGDAFTAGFLWWMLRKNEGSGPASGGGGGGRSGRDALRALQSDPGALADAVAFGAATGALTCTRPGAIASQPRLEEVMALFEKERNKGGEAARAA